MNRMQRGFSSRPFSETVERIRNGLVVSCQANEGDPMDRPEHLAAFAKSAELGGACGIRACGAENIAAIRARVALPIIAIDKVHHPDSAVYITPTFADAVRVAKAGGDIIALDATSRPRPGGERLDELIARIRSELRLPVMADVSTLEEGIAAERAGADLVATTLAGYTEYSRKVGGPDLLLVEELVKACSVPVVAEGRFETPAQVAEAFRLGAFAVVVGAAITQPIALTRRFVAATAAGRPAE